MPCTILSRRTGKPRSERGARPCPGNHAVRRRHARVRARRHDQDEGRGCRQRDARRFGPTRSRTSPDTSARPVGRRSGPAAAGAGRRARGERRHTSRRRNRRGRPPRTHPRERHDRTAEPGDPPAHARRGKLPGRERRVDARMRRNPLRHRERMVDPPLSGHAPAR